MREFYDKIILMVFLYSASSNYEQVYNDISYVILKCPFSSNHHSNNLWLLILWGQGQQPGTHFGQCKSEYMQY